MAKRLKVLIKRLEDAHKDQDKELERTIKINSKVILDLNKQQLFEGVDSTGKSLGQYKSKWYAKLKRMLNPNGVVDLYLTGKFYAGFYLKKIGFPIQIDSKDKKRNKLVDDYGGKIFGLNKESKELFAKDYIKDGLLKYYKKVLHLR
jgi:hypothetical protein